MACPAARWGNQVYPETRGGPSAQSGPEQRVRRQQRDVVAGGAVDLQGSSTHQPFANPRLQPFSKTYKARHAVALVTNN